MSLLDHRKVFEQDVIANIDNCIRNIYKSIAKNDKKRAMELISMLSYQSDFLDDRNELKRKEKMAQKALFHHYLSPSIPTDKALEDIVKFINKDRVLEINAGVGLWGKLLRLFSVDLEMINRESLGFESSDDIQSVQSATQHFDDNQNDFACLMICRPDVHKGELLEDALHCVKKFTGFKLICILNELVEPGTVFEYLQQSEDWELVNLIEIPVWFGETDSVLLYERKQNSY